MRINLVKPIFLLGCLGLMTFTSCEEGDKVFDEIIENVERGGVLRTVSLQSELPLGAENELFFVEVEVQTEESGSLFNDVEVFIGFNDNTALVGDGTDVGEVLFTTVPASQFTTGEFGYPRYRLEIPFGDLLSFVGKSSNDVTGGDQFTVRFVLNMSDGRSFTNADNSGTLTGSFFNSPFLYTPTIICPIPEGAFTGEYAVTQQTPGIFGAMIRETTATLTAPNTTTRIIAANLYPQFGGGAGFDREFSIELICDEIVMPTYDTGLACADPNITFIQLTRTPYDANDDSTFDLIFTEDGGGCGGSAEITLTFTKN